ncbi:MAG: Glycyl-glycine endopeptidase [Verrucomicrobiales bacterium]|nr:Glycyl-glycine endopeptidase [Verrucomicrobiales bacterium]
MKITPLSRRALFLFIALLIPVATVPSARAQLSPGPYEMLPFEDGFIIEAFKDLQTSAGSIADWTGYSGTSWVSPNAYDDHIGSDFSVQTGTPLFSVVAGTVVEVVNGFPRDDHSTYSGNYIRIACDAPAPNGEAIDVRFLHMLQVSATVGQRVKVGDYVGLSDNTGNSTSEHVHFQTEIRTNASPTCGFYWAHFKYPIIFNTNGNLQVGRVVKVTANSTPIRTNRFDTSLQINTAYKDQLYFASFPKRGYYQVFIPNNASWRSGWVRATDVTEVFEGTVIQPLPDNGTFSQLGQLTNKYTIRSSPDDGAGQIGQILFGGGRFVADQITNGYYRIPLPTSSATWGWVKANNRMVVYPQLTNPSLNLAALRNNDFPIRESFSTNYTNGVSMFGRPKFNRSVVKSFSPSSPGGDGKALFVTDESNHGNGSSESVLVGKPGHTNYFVQCDVYFNYQPGYLPTGEWERRGIFLRDDGFAGIDTTFEGAGNCYAMLWDNDDGNLRAAKITDGAITNFISPTLYVTGSGWHKFRIEARTNQIKFFFDDTLLLQTNESTFFSGQCGLGYSYHGSKYPAGRGAYFDNFVADTLDPVPLRFGLSSRKADGWHFILNSDVGSTSMVERAGILTNWTFFTNVVSTNSVVEFLDTATNNNAQFYRARKIP